MADVVGLDKLTGGLSLNAIKGGVMDIAVYIIWGLVLSGVAVFAYLKYQDKKIFIYPVRIFRQRNNGIVKELNTFGGYVKKGNFTQFLIKQGRFKKKALDKLPISEMMDEDNRVYYWQVSPESPLIQCRKDFVVEQILQKNDKFIEPTKEEIESKTLEVIEVMKLEEEYKDLKEEELKEIALGMVKQDIDLRRNEMIDITKPTYTPVPTDLKAQALLDINNYKNTLGVDVNKQFAYFVIGVIALVIVGIVVFYVAVNKGDIPILTK